MNVLIWHVHGSWTTAFVQGRHRYLLPVVPDRGPDGRGRAVTWDWPSAAVEVSPEELADTPLDVVVLQRARDAELAQRWLGGRRPGRDIPAVWLEHNAPQGPVNAMHHPARDVGGVHVVHVTHTNALLWDTGTAPTRVIEHGVVDPGLRYLGEVERAAVVINEPVRRHRVTGTDLLARLAAAVPLDLFGMGVEALASSPQAADRQASGGAPVRATRGAERPPAPCIQAFEDLPQHRLHHELARRRLYLHPYRWTSLGLALIEAMLLGLPVAALATLEVPSVVPPAAGVVTNDLDRLAVGLRRLACDPGQARQAGLAARAAALDRFGLQRFLADWDRLFEEIT